MDINKAKMLSITIVVIMVMAGALVVFTSPVSARAVTEAVYKHEIPMAISQADIGRNVDKGSLVGSEATASAVGTSIIKQYWTWDEYLNLLFPVDIMKRGEGANCEIWVGTDNLFPEGDPRNAYTSRFNLTDAQVNYIIAQFETTIYPTEKTYFGDAPVRTGENATMYDQWHIWHDTFNTTSGKKTMIVIYNILDQNYYFPDYSYFVAGYYWDYMSNIYDRNIINIDVYDWANRTTSASLDYPFLMEGTVAHEYQHLIHDAYNHWQDLWVDEGCSELAQMICGYGVPKDDIAAFLENPSDSLTYWEPYEDWMDMDPLINYGSVALFTIYLNDKFGGANTISNLVHSKYQGIAGINDALKQAGYSSWDFNKVFKAWRIANLLDANQPGNGMYKYKSLNIADIDAELHVYNNMKSFFGYWTRPYSTDYTWTPKPSNMNTYDRLHTYVDFSALDISYDTWSWSGHGWRTCDYENIDNILMGTIDLTQPGPSEHTLEIYTAWDTEDYHDYGFVQVSTDGGATWESLQDELGHMISDDPYGLNPKITENFPGLTGYNEWEWLSFDLSAYDNMVIKVRFRYMTDESNAFNGWYIDNIKVDGMEYNEHGVSYLSDSGVFAPCYKPIKWYVTLVLYRNNIPMGIVDMKINDVGDISVGGQFYSFKLRAVQGFIMLVSPTDWSDYYEWNLDPFTPPM